jgi:hypothetical protein
MKKFSLIQYLICTLLVSPLISGFVGTCLIVYTLTPYLGECNNLETKEERKICYEDKIELVPDSDLVVSFLIPLLLFLGLESWFTYKFLTQKNLLLKLTHQTRSSIIRPN